MTGTVTLHANDKGDNPKRPDAVGMGTDLDGRRIRAAAWWNADGTLTVKWEPAKDQPAADQAQPRPPSPPPGSSQATTAAAADSADEIPF
jgi:hypothetical protein